jgi:parvulin-like peptidyl-prolyl isomerase
MDLWGFPKDAAYKMMKMEIGEFYPPAPIYKGFGVFKILEKRIADEAKYPQRKDSYYEQIRSKKRYEGLKEWIKDLKQRASIRVY